MTYFYEIQKRIMEIKKGFQSFALYLNIKIIFFENLLIIVKY